MADGRCALIRIAEYQVERMRMRFLRSIQTGIESAGIRVKRSRPGIVFELGGYLHRLWVSYYSDERFWRISCGPGGMDDGFGPYELTMLAAELGPETGATVIEFLRAPRAFRWPIFAHHQSYPKYSWSEAAQEEMNRVLAETEARRRLARNRFSKTETATVEAIGQ